MFSVKISAFVVLAGVLVAGQRGYADADYDLLGDWSDTANPNGVWSYNEGSNPLPHVDWWERMRGSWSSPQPGWARSEDSNNRIPFWFRSNGTEQFANDFQAGDIVVHTTDAGNGVGNGPGNVTWTSPIDGLIDITGAVWMGRDIGRGNDWSILLNEVALTGGSLFSGDAYFRAAPFDFATGSGGPDVLTDVSVSTGDVVKLELVRNVVPGDFVGVNMAITIVPEPTTLSLLSLGGVALMRIRRRRP